MPPQGGQESGLTQEMGHCRLTGGPFPVQPPPGLELPTLRQDQKREVDRETRREGQGHTGWREWTEETIQANFEFIQASRQADTCPEEHDVQGLYDIQHAFQNWEAFLKLLRNLGYEPGTNCHWKALGLDPATITTSAENLIEDRAERLRLLLGEALKRIPTHKDTTESILLALHRTREWREQCRDEMMEAHQSARRRSGSKLQVLLEPPAGLEEAITSLAHRWEPLGERSWISALWLTDARSLLRSGHQSGVLSPTEAQTLTEALLRSSNSATAAMEKLPGSNLILWMPREAAQGGRLLAHIQAILTAGEETRKIVVVCERTPTPTNPPPELLMDYWKSPLRQDKWNHMVQQITHLKEPEFLTISSEGQLQQALRSYTVVLLGSGIRGPGAPTLTSWKRTIQGPEDAHVIQIEIPQRRHMAVRRSLYKLADRNAFQWDGPSRSPASKGNSKRLIFRVYAPWHDYTELGVYLLIGRLRKAEGLEHANIGPESLGASPGAKIMETQCWEAVADVMDLVQAILVISPMETILTTSATQQAWEQRLTELHMANPKGAPRALRWRYDKGNGVWARPRTLINMAPRSKGRPHPGRLYLMLQGSMGPSPPDLLRAIMGRVQELTRTALHEQEQDAELSINQWRPELDPGALQTGHIELLLQDEQQAAHFQELLTNLSVEVQQRTIPLLVTGDSLVAGTFRRT